MESYYYLIETEGNLSYISERIMITGSFITAFETFFTSYTKKSGSSAEDYVQEAIYSNKNPKREFTFPERKIKTITKVFMSEDE